MPSPKSPTSTSTSTSTSTYRELHIPASDLVPFMQSIYSQHRVGTLTVSFGTGGVPCGMLVWKERVDERMDEKSEVNSEPKSVESTSVCCY